MTDRNCLTCLYIAPQSCDHRTHWCAKLGEWVAENLAPECEWFKLRE